MQERENERERMRKKKDAREGDVTVESSDVMPRETEWAGWGIQKTPATRSAFPLDSSYCVVYTDEIFRFHQSHQKES